MSKKFLEWAKGRISTKQGKLFFIFAIRLKETGRVIGSIDFKNPHPRCGQIDYVCAHNYWGKGIVTEAAMAVRDWAWKDFPDLDRIQAFCMVDNLASARVMEKVGMKSEGIQRKSFWNKGEAVDIAYFAMLR